MSEGAAAAAPMGAEGAPTPQLATPQMQNPMLSSPPGESRRFGKECAMSSSCLPRVGRCSSKETLTPPAVLIVTDPNRCLYEDTRVLVRGCSGQCSSSNAGTIGGSSLMEMLRSMSQAGYSKGQLVTSRPGSGLPMSHALLDPSMQPPSEATPDAALVGAGPDLKPSPAVPTEPMLATPTSVGDEPRGGFVAALGSDALQLPSLSSEAQQQQQEQQQSVADHSNLQAAATQAPADISQPQPEDAEPLEAAPDAAAIEAQGPAAAQSAAADAPSTAQPLGEPDTQTAAVAAQQTDRAAWAAGVAPAGTERSEAAGDPGQVEGLVEEPGMQPGAQAEGDMPEAPQPAMHGSMAPDSRHSGLMAPESAETPAAAEATPAEPAAAVADVAVATEAPQPEVHKGPAEAEGEAVPQETAAQEPAPDALPMPGTGTAAAAPEQMASPAEGGGTPAEAEPQLPAEDAAAALPVATDLEEPSQAQTGAIAQLVEVLHEPTADEAQPTHHAEMGEHISMPTELSTVQHVPAADESIAAIPESGTQGVAPSLMRPPSEEGLHGPIAQKVASVNATPGGDQVEAEVVRGVSVDADRSAGAAPEPSGAGIPDC